MMASRWVLLSLLSLLILPLSSCGMSSSMENVITALPEADPIEEPAENSQQSLISGNPIDEAFKTDFDIASSTPEINYLSNVYLEAWQDEWDNITTALLNQLEMDEDRQVIRDYRLNFQAYAESLYEVEWLDYTDTSVPAEEHRLVGTGAMSAAALAQASAYKREVLLWIDRYYIEDSYSYKYKGSGAQLLQRRDRE